MENHFIFYEANMHRTIKDLQTSEFNNHSKSYKGSHLHVEWALFIGFTA